MKKTNRIEVVEHAIEIPDLPAGLEGLRIVQFSDLHGPKPIEFIRQINGLLREARGDLLVTTGDILDHGHWLSAAWRQLPVLLEGVPRPAGFYGVLGNHDRMGIVPVLKTLGARVLFNQWQQVPVGGAVLNIGGLCAKRLRDFPSSFAQMATSVPTAGPTILLSHVPSAIWTFSGKGVNLVLSGHTHGGQWRFGRLGCLWAHDAIPRQMAYGLQKVGPTYLYVTAGLGESGPIPVRFNCPAEIAVMTLRRCKDGC